MGFHGIIINVNTYKKRKIIEVSEAHKNYTHKIIVSKLISKKNLENSPMSQLVLEGLLVVEGGTNIIYSNIRAELQCILKESSQRSLSNVNLKFSEIFVYLYPLSIDT